ncbi:hypothetical protein Gohar_008711, partial [Gossypium harknessii]|nr:hypothetical protein [Gossypium harknessii]
MDCLAGRDIWNNLIPIKRLSRFFSGSLREWMLENLHNQQTFRLERVDWHCLFRILTWRISKNRNLFIFQGISWSVGAITKESYRILDGLTLILDRGFESVLIQTDRLEAVNAIQ